jgi:predicted nucleic acid-binding protein
LVGTLEDGFEGYLTPSQKELSDAVVSGLIVLDTNVLLDLYTHDSQVRGTALEILNAARERVWVPHQVAREFWRNRLLRIAQATRRADKVAEGRQGILAAVNLLRPYGRDDRFDEVKSLLNQKFDEIEAIINAARGEQFDAHEVIANSSADPVLRALSELLEGHVGEAFSADDESLLIKTAQDRAAARIPPGYEDEEKSPEKAAGDFLLWEQTLRHVEALGNCKAFVLVTQDSKSDWRVPHPLSRNALGPHPALVQEALIRTGARLHLLRPEEFYQVAGPLFSIDSRRTESLAAASAVQNDSRQVTWLQAAEIVMTEAGPDDWWSAEELLEAIIGLGLRDITAAKTPIQTLRRDLNSYGHRRFVKEGGLYRLKREDELDLLPLI